MFVNAKVIFVGQCKLSKGFIATGLVSIPKGRKRAIFGAVRKHLGAMLNELAK